MLCSPSSFANKEHQLKIAVSANFAKPVEVLLKKFAKTHPVNPQISIASTGVLYQQIRHGAPFDLYFSADIRRPQLLEEQDLILANYRKTYALGRLAIWSAISNKPIKISDLESHNGRIAIAGPHIAPYGLASKQALVSLNLWHKYHNQLITGNNINQTYQQTITGAVKYGFISYSQLLNSKTGHGILLDDHLHEPLEQQMVVLKNAENTELATQFFEYILSIEAQQLIQTLGYSPAITVPKILAPKESANEDIIEQLAPEKIKQGSISG